MEKIQDLLHKLHERRSKQITLTEEEIKNDILNKLNEILKSDEPVEEIVSFIYSYSSKEEENLIKETFHKCINRRNFSISYGTYGYIRIQINLDKKFEFSPFKY